MLRFLPVVAICTVIVLFFLYNFLFSVDFPFQDDFLFIQFIDAISKPHVSFWDLVKEMFRTFNDHKAVVPRFISLLDYELTGRLHFRFYIVLVLTNLVYIFYFLYHNYNKAKLPLYLFIPVPLLFFHPLYHEVSGWALTGMQHTYLTAFTVTAIMLAARGTAAAFYGAMLCCFLATFTHGNGILSFPAIIFFFLCRQHYRQAIMAAVFMILCLVLYLAGYESGQAVHLPKDAASFFLSLFGFIGSEMSLWQHSELYAALWGAAILTCMVMVTWRVASVYFKKPLTILPGTIELLTLFAFIFVSSLVVALFRSWAGTTIASRFQLYAALSTAIFYIFLVFYTDIFKKKWVFAGALVCSVFYWAYSHYRFSNVVAAKKTTYLADIYNWRNYRRMFSVEKSIVSYANFYLLPAYQQGYFALPEALITPGELNGMFEEKTVPGHNGTYIEKWEVRRIVRSGEEQLQLYFISSTEWPKRMPFWDDRFMALRNTATGATYLLSATPKVETRKEILTGMSYYKKGFNAQLRENDLDPGTYEMGILNVSNGGDKTFYRMPNQLVSSGKGYMLR